MARSKETFGKKEVRNKQEKKRKDKAARKAERKEQGKKSFDDMIAWVDENGNLSNTPPDLTQKEEVDIESIEIGVPKAGERINSKIKTGRLTTFDERKGFGFIAEDNSSESYFVHISDCLSPVKGGDKVEFETEKGDRGMKAVKVKAL